MYHWEGRSGHHEVATVPRKLVLVAETLDYSGVVVVDISPVPSIQQ